ncbi:hypothetical protein NC653_039096 [Populus alba x Populus x berolinensis]|uniref:Uncharacterized protein n=1 Tax=Populus alba x Populus x berolinensis TaxID=444605 RepID=A0AAD6LAF4_9ROSI|nr:hypothetical protein NC653_039096 [Populus alba x Populus x berolinensis]
MIKVDDEEYRASCLLVKTSSPDAYFLKEAAENFQVHAFMFYNARESKQILTTYMKLGQQKQGRTRVFTRALHTSASKAFKDLAC